MDGKVNKLENAKVKLSQLLKLIKFSFHKLREKVMNVLYF